ncbi:TrbC/VirB2 family protein [sulfur-oxidizing endosymbiont of Gigantopelta aegis]|uniref:TrbC/VirB2 family protein n=1 Tax=sulfur-oxidizing endosymbiont of Gigantopelta aegis TaxID=2794934 RepID=UPI0018DBD8CF|nr:TrbC/VirB2 family protein [sulfur-oxidizing endosymbiont of Gigantopelta aegis]
MKKRENQGRKLALLAVVMAGTLLPELAFAGTGGNPILNGVNWLMNLLNSTLATSVAILAITVLGYMAFAGRLAADIVLRFIIGIVLVFGGARIVALITGSI